MKLSLRTAIALAILLGLLLPAAISGLISVQREMQSVRADMDHTQTRYLDILVLGMQEPLWNLAPEAGKPLLDALMSDERIVRIIVNDASLGVFLTKNLPERRQGHLRSMTHAVNKQGNNIGTITLEMDDGTVTREIENTHKAYLIAVLVQATISLALILFILHSRILAPMRQLSSQAKKLAGTELDTPFAWHRDDEIGALGQNLEATRKAIKSLLGTLEQKTIQLETDLISRQQIESALIASQNRYRRLVETTDVIPWDANPGEWRFTYVGPQAERLLGYPISNWYGEGFLSSYLHPDDRHLAYQLFTDTQSENFEFECRMLAKDGQNIWALVVASSQMDSNNRRRLHGFILNITARKQAEIELEKYRNHLEDLVDTRTRALTSCTHELEAFSYSVSHDLRTPLRTIDGFSQVLLEDYGDTLDANARHYLQRIRSAITGMASLIEDLLNLSKLSRSELRRQEVNLSTLAQDIAEELNALQIGHEISIEIAPDMYANVDPKLIRIVLHNLLDNAWKFSSPMASPHVRFSVSTVNQQQVYFISDNGIGFDMKDANKLFSPFQHLHPQSEHTGNGIGLAIVQRIISRHDGHIWAKALPNEGATFYFTLPAPKKTE